MNAFDNHSISFIIRIWREKAEDNPERYFWRGHITSIPSNEKQYISNIDDIANFILHRLENFVVQSDNSSPFQLLWKKRRINGK